MEDLSEFLDSTTGLGYHITFSCEMGGFFMIETKREDFNGNKYCMKQTLGKDHVTEDRIKQLVNWQTIEIQKQANEREKKS